MSALLDQSESLRAVLVIEGDGSVRSSAAAKSLLGLPLGHRGDLDRRFAVTGTSGSVLGVEEVPWRQHETSLVEPQRWQDRTTGKTRRLLVSALPIGECLFLELQSELPTVHDRGPEEHVEALLAMLNQSLRGDGRDRLRGVLELIVELATELTDAEYGALGVLAPDGQTLQDFVYFGMTSEQAARIGSLPKGRGLLGALIHEGKTIRLADLGRDPRSVGVPHGHPPLTSFLGTPVRVGEKLFGNFYLANKRGEPEFNLQDEHRLERFSAQAGLTIELARRADEDQTALFEALVERAPYGIVHRPADPAERGFANLVAQRMLGCSRSAADPFFACTLTLPDGQPLPPEAHPVFRAAHGETVVNTELRVLRPGTSPLPVRISAAPVNPQGAGLSGVLCVCQALSTWEELERLRHEFAAVVAHDMRTPLQAILLQVEGLLRRAEGEAAWVPVRALETMRRSSVRLSRLMADLLDASRLESEQLRLDRERVDVLPLIQSVVEQMRLVAPERVIELRAEPVPPILADPVRIEQVLSNLLDNAIKYSPDGSPVRLGLEHDPLGISIWVEDQGAGIAPGALPKLFDRFYRAPGASRSRPGLGLGLYIARGLAVAHGGSLTATSTEGVGSRFSLWLPATTRA